MSSYFLSPVLNFTIYKDLIVMCWIYIWQVKDGIVRTNGGIIRSYYINQKWFWAPFWIPIIWYQELYRTCSLCLCHFPDCTKKSLLSSPYIKNKAIRQLQDPFLIFLVYIVKHDRLTFLCQKIINGNGEYAALHILIS